MARCEAATYDSWVEGFIKVGVRGYMHGCSRGVLMLPGATYEVDARQMTGALETHCGLNVLKPEPPVSAGLP